jgi:hypothetical protein
MIYMKMVDGVEVEMTPEEITRRRAEEAAWSAGAVKRDALAHISSLEASITQRRIREAALTDAGKAWLAGVDSQIATLRAQLVP